MERKEIRAVEKTISWLDRNITAELRNVRLYENNIHLFPSPEQNSAVKKLAVESLKHARSMAEAKHELELKLKRKQTKTTLKNRLKVLVNALREEKAMEDIYMHQAKKVKDKNVSAMLEGIAGMEIEHQKIVKKLAAETAKDLSKTKAKSMLKKMKLI